jgi:hypothetical protein
MARIRSKVGLLSGLALLLAMTAGCPDGSGKETAHLQGTVTIGGQPIPADATGGISFVPLEVSQANSDYSAIKDGKYDVPGAPVGKVRVEFSIQQPTG